MAYAWKQQDNNPLFRTFLQVGEGLLGKGDAADLAPRLRVSPGQGRRVACSPLTPAHLPRQWCEKHKRSGRQTLGDLLIKPHQRITKYPLLLQAVLKRSPEARAREALTAMVGATGAVPSGVGGW